MSKERESADVTLSFCCTLSEAKPIYREASRRRISVSRYLRLLVSTRLAALDTHEHPSKTVETLSKKSDL